MLKAINASHVSVTFNDKVEYASAVGEFKDNYIFTKNGEKLEGNTLEVAVKSVYLMADGKTVVFEFNADQDGFGNLNHGDQYGIDVKNAVKNAKGEKLEAYGDTQKEFRDQAAPVIQNTKFTGKAVEIYYNEPVNMNDNDFGISIDGTKIDKSSIKYKTIQKFVDEKEQVAPDKQRVSEIQYVVTVPLNDTTSAHKALLEKGTHEVVVYNMRDQVKSTSQAGNKVQLARASYEVKEGQETDLAVVAIDPIDFNSLNVEFNKAAAKGKITVYKGDTKFYEKEFNQSTKDVDVNLPYTIKSEQDGITSLYAKDATSTDVRVVVENYEDENAKLGEKVEKTLTLVREATKPAPVNEPTIAYKVDEATGLLKDDNVPTITIPLLDRTGKDYVGNLTAVAGVDLTKAVTVLDKDGVSRTISKVTAENDNLVIELANEKGSKQKFEDLFNFTVKVDANAVKVGTDKIDVASPKTITPQADWAENDATNELTNDAFQVIVEKKTTNKPEDSNFKYIEGVKEVKSSKDNTNVITVTYNDSMTASAAKAANYMLDGKALPQGTKMSMDATGKVVTITLPKGSVAKTHEARLQITKDVKTLNNEIIVGSLTDKEMFMTKEVIQITDNTAPTLASAQYAVAKADDKTASVIELTFSEAIELGSNPETNFEFLANGTKAIEIKAVEAVAGDDNKNKVTITLAEAVSTQQKATITVASKDKDGKDVTIVITDEDKNELTKGSTVTIPAKSVVVSDKVKAEAAKEQAIKEAEKTVTKAKAALEAAKQTAENDTTVTQAMADAKEEAIKEVQAVKDAQTALENANNAKTEAEKGITSDDVDKAKTALNDAKTEAEDVKDVDGVKATLEAAEKLDLGTSEKEDIDAATKAINVAVAEAKVANATKALEDAKKAAETDSTVTEAEKQAQEEAIKKVQAVKDAEEALTKAQEELAAAKQ